MKYKVVTICGSMKFADVMRDIAYDLEVKKGYCVIQCVYKPDNYCENNQSKEEIENLTNAHWKKIDVSDAIFVINVGGYIGKQTQKEIEYALSKGKEVIYLENK